MQDIIINFIAVVVLALAVYMIYFLQKEHKLNNQLEEYYKECYKSIVMKTNTKQTLIDKIKDLQLSENGHDYIEEVGVGYYSPTFDKVILEDDELQARSVKELLNIYDDLKTNYSY